MAATHSLIRNFSGGGTTLSTTNDYTGTGEANVLAEAVADSVTDQFVNISIDVSAIQSIFMLSSTALTVDTNTTAGVDTIVLVADVPYIWHLGSYFANLLTTDVTALYLTNASGAAATFDLRCVYDATP